MARGEKTRSGRIAKLRQAAIRYYQFIRPLFPWVPLVAVCLWFVWNFPYMNGSYTLKEVKKAETAPAAAQPVYSYYLDFSPSMQGFMLANDGTMGQLAQALAGVNRSGGENNRFFFCDSVVRTATSQVFYECLTTGEAIGNYYDDLTVDADENTGLSTSGITETELRQALEALNLSNQFTFPTTEGYRYEEYDENVNVIITDLNFYLPSSGTARQDELLDEFARHIAQLASSANLCIYHLQSGFYGLRDDSFSEGDRLALRGVPYFVIVLAKNVLTFDEYLEKIEGALARYGLSYSDKFVMKTDPARDGQPIAFNEEAFFDAEATVRSGFNFANGLITGRPDAAIALQLLERQSGSAYLQLPVTALDGLLPGVDTQSGLVEGSFEVQVSTALPALLDLGQPRREEGDSKLGDTMSCRAYVSNYQDQDYLTLEFSASAPAESITYKPYYVADIQFYMRKMVFSVPGWVETLNTTDGTGSDGSVRNLSGFFQLLLESKGADYANLPENQRYLGSVAVYVAYD